MEEQIKIRGYLSKFLYKSNSWALAIFISEENNKKTIKIKGEISDLKPKVLYELTGSLTNHLKYGTSFEVSSYTLANINNEEQIINFLKSDVFPGIGNLTATKIAKLYTNNFIQEILNNKEEFFKIKDVSKDKLELIYNKIKEINEQNWLRIEFINHNLSLKILDKLKKYVEDEHELKQLFVNNWFEFAFKHNLGLINEIDKIFLHFNNNKTNDLTRLAYYSLYVCNEILFNTGNSYTDQYYLLKKLSNLIKINDQNLLLEGLEFAFNNNLLVKNNSNIYTYESYYDELIISDVLVKNYLITDDFDDDLISSFINQIQINISKDFKYDDNQVLALKNFIKNKISIITGGPGTGKTTIIKAIVRLFEKVYHSTNYAICTPTGRAAARIRESFLECNATTIHKLLGYEKDNKFSINANNPLDYDLLIVDECSMIDTRLFSQFLSSISKAKKIVLIGDVDQLTSVSYGNAFFDIISSKIISTTNLKKIHRQNNNNIIDLAYMIKNNTFDLNKFNDSNNVEFFFNKDKQACLDKLKTIYQQSIDQNLNIQIISPVYADILGIENLNNFIQYNFNQNILDQNNVYDRLRFRYAINDKVMYLKNDSELNLSNGDIGYIKQINKINNQFQSAIINFNNIELEFDAQQFDDISLSYCCSVHKTQGSEYDKVILVLQDTLFSSFLNKKLLYTAITRAKKQLVIIGDYDLFNFAIKQEAKLRKTTLTNQILNKISERK
ncbi:AAA family ATPase [Mycoplasma feriruminatoris]|uniref:Exodeoxyribonuclease V subunit alpha n=1 Tax=Mycoplasma feriruminatoris TaxID=1179777 RepID=A0AAQ3DND4_9MOLU|nr:AAA family ATPase [Mycoplasma feriruminatoris]UKS54094.1 ATPase associated with various cellularactivities family protein [Mycoplasma feriruminatoris]WFQ94330.1 ATP-dependent RecD-like DNA helicase [Mycoplasma feriruminatoris]WFQ95150.1 exodeoxyribonuclease V subunit alpha [Mycoplasma feriruminatoris]VZK65260.1 ATP-dependent RecD-like DNA helicase [Mycoplasma feriruminatoris]VZR75409.1 ATP-dependent RecD-like DNA helicase [Mycoplasma feriruminatoris]